MSNSLPLSRRPRANGGDAQRSSQANAKGVFVHALADCQSVSIGKGSKVWQFTVVLPGAVIGRNCNINSHCFIENDVVIGNNVTVKCGVYLWDGLRIEDDVFLGPNATFMNDRFPRSKRYPKRFLQTIIKRGASVGAGAVVLPGLTIGERSLVGAGAIVTRNVAARAVIRGQAAAIVRSIEE